MKVTIPDDILDPYLAMAESQGRPIEEVVAAQLKRFHDLVPGAKAIVIGKADQEILGKRLGGDLRSGKDLVERVLRLAGLTFGNVQLDFSISQLAELQHRSDRSGRPVEALAKEITDTVLRDFFWGSGGGAAAERKAG